MYIILKSEKFSDWMQKLKDLKGKIAIARRIARAQNGNLGNVKTVGDNVFEMRVDFGPGYRVYYTMKDGQIIILLCGGDKSTQQKDIEKAKELARDYK